MSSYDEHLISMAGGDGDTIADVLAAHQKVSMGMSYGSPDTCRCGAQAYPDRSDTEVTLRRDVAFGAHQADMLTAAGFGPEQFALVRSQQATIDRVLNLANSSGRCGWRISADELRKVLGAS